MFAAHRQAVQPPRGQGRLLLANCYHSGGLDFAGNQCDFAFYNCSRNSNR
jgi:hypothetical protein